MLRSYFFKLLRSPFLYAGMICVLGLCLFGAYDSLGGSKGLSGSDVFSDMHLLLEMKGYRKAFIIFAAIPFAANFADEWNSKAIINCITRKSALSYAVSNVTVCFVSSLLTVFVPMIIFAAASGCGSKIFYNGTSGAITYSEFLEMGLPFLSIVFYFFTFALSCAMWAVTGMTLTAFFPSKYIAIGAPFIFSNVVERITLDMPPMSNFMGLSMSHIGLPAAAALGYAFLVFGGLSAVCGIVFTIKIEKRVRNELG